MGASAKNQDRWYSVSNEHYEGGCQCGSIRFRSTGEPVRVIACHCTTCKQRTGAAYGIGVYFGEHQIEILQGSSSIFEFHSDTSGRWLKNEFCPKCGSCFSWTTEMRPGLRAIAGGSYDDTDWYTVDAHIWSSSARSDMCFPQDMLVCNKALQPEQ